MPRAFSLQLLAMIVLVVVCVPARAAVNPASVALDAIAPNDLTHSSASPNEIQGSANDTSVVVPLPGGTTGGTKPGGTSSEGTTSAGPATVTDGSASPQPSNAGVIAAGLAILTIGLLSKHEPPESDLDAPTRLWLEGHADELMATLSTLVSGDASRLAAYRKKKEPGSPTVFRRVSERSKMVAQILQSCSDASVPALPEDLPVAANLQASRLTSRAQKWMSGHADALLQLIKARTTSHPELLSDLARRESSTRDVFQQIDARTHFVRAIAARCAAQ